MPQITPSNGYGWDAVLLAVERWYNFPELGVIWEMSVDLIMAPTTAGDVNFNNLLI